MFSTIEDRLVQKRSLDLGACSEVERGADMNATMTARRGMRVAAQAAAVGVSADTIRYYERDGSTAGPGSDSVGLPGLQRP